MPKNARYPNEKIKELATGISAGNRTGNAKEIARTMLRENPEIKYDLEHLSTLIRKMKKDGSIPAETAAAETPNAGERYSVSDGTYRWKYAKGEMELAIEEADNMFYEYSRHGLDLSQAQMRQRHDLKIWEWNTIKNVLFLYKDSNIVSPHTEDNTPRERLGELLDQRMGMKMRDKQRLIVDAYEKETIRRYKNAIDGESKKTFACQAMIDALDEIVETHAREPITLKTSFPKKGEKPGPNLLLAVADLHIGAETTGEKTAPDWDREKAEKNLACAAETANALAPEETTLAIIGDLIESFTGTNHPSSWKSIEKGMHGARLVMETVRILENFFAKIANLKKVIIISGNHDRMTSSKKEDSRGEIAEIIAYVLQKSYGDRLEITYSDTVASTRLDNLTCVFTHGDKKNPRHGADAAIDHGTPGRFTLVLSGHNHSRKTLQDAAKYRWIQIPAIFSGNRFSDENGFTALPGFVTVTDNGHGLPAVTDHTIPTE